MNFKKYLVLLFIFILLSFALYGNSINGDFVHDDFFFANRLELKNPNYVFQIWNEPYLPHNNSAGLFRPLTLFSFILNFVLFGSSTKSFHITNIVLNGLISFLVFLVCYKLFKRLSLSLFIALLFAFLPIHSEAISSIKGREELLSAFFGLLSWLFFIKITENSKIIKYFQIILSAFLYLLAVLTKELILFLPAIFLVDLFFKKSKSKTMLIKIASIYAVTLVLYFFWRYTVLGEYAFGKDNLYFAVNPLAYTDFWTRFLTAFKIAFIYIGKTYIPWNLSASYHYNQLPLVTNLFTSWQAIFGFTLLLLLVFVAFSIRWRNSPIQIGSLTFIITFFIFSKFLFKGGDLLAERWMYFPSIGLSIIGGFLFDKLFKKNKLLGSVIFTSVLMTYSWILIPRNLVWRSSESLYKSMIKSAPKSVMGHWGLADYYFGKNQMSQAKKEAEIAYSIDKDYPPLLNIVGQIAYKEGNYKLAKAAFYRATIVAPTIGEGFRNAAMVYYRLGEYENAKRALKRLVYKKSKSRDSDIIDYALVLAKLGKHKESLSVIISNFGQEPIHSKARLVLAINYFKTGNIKEAQKFFDWNNNLLEKEKLKLLDEF
ncbi:hypothetical protein A2774_01145 [Candidatus Roizmanbacteria bacterium RIFCSPHIGHO2_01_FULL_39_12c]|uniref:Uncharacterized protein n=1 Tax=Candidatus Roizmanbacteria bacterium RIFCSPHIGHO2_01_FULL_39_12c TaxID=1802031 RepID=A0A1F7G7W1_9BACT|nr:MAG: hypothetical protein A2774_01145 [Candidatus Roizmanbacteria bacterium RIFCSPHIGHO2_01_FULL_39_12c]OGK46435.1 MAG: hypothetical protein A2963_01550 [Candidatus Roizmanbacteria bacterium RIFCSPLOWO2_01_FULL_40_13]